MTDSYLIEGTALIVASVAEPVLKPNLIDRILVTSEKSQIRPVICLNKVDLVDLANLQPLMGVYGQMGYQVVALSAETGVPEHILLRATLARARASWRKRFKSLSSRRPSRPLPSTGWRPPGAGQRLWRR